MPSARASRGEWRRTSPPSTWIVPASGGTIPPAMCIRVDLPAPFSPTSACTSPAANEKSAPRTARTGPKDLRMPRSSRSWGLGPACWGLGGGCCSPFTVHRSLFTVHGLQSCRMIVKLPWQPELRRAVLRQRFDSHRLGGVVACVDGVDPELHRIEIGVVGALAGDVRVHSGRLCGCDPASGSPRDDTHPLALFGPARHQLGRDAQQG